GSASDDEEENAPMTVRTTGVPKAARALLEGTDVGKATLELEERFVLDGAAVGAGPTVAALLAGLPSATRPEAVLRAAGDLVGRDVLRAWLLDPADPAGVAADAADAVVAHRQHLWAALDDGRPAVRAAAAFALGAAPAALAGEAHEHL